MRQRDGGREGEGEREERKKGGEHNYVCVYMCGCMHERERKPPAMRSHIIHTSLSLPKPLS